MITERKKVGLLVLPVVSVLLFGCQTLDPLVDSVAEPEFKELGLCQALMQESDWLDAAVAAESNWGLPLHVSLAELNMAVGTEATAYIHPRHSDWESYRVATENWQAETGDIATALDFLGWHAQLAMKHNKVEMGQAGELFLVYQLGHGGYQRQQQNPNQRLEKEARLIDQRAAQYRKELKGCPQIRQRAGSFFRLPW